MVTEFQEGETYTNPNNDKDIMVLGVAKETKDDVTLAILWVDRESKESTSGDSLIVKKDDFKNWSEVEI